MLVVLIVCGECCLCVLSKVISKVQSGEPNAINNPLLSDPNNISSIPNKHRRHATRTVIRRLLST